MLTSLSDKVLSYYVSIIFEIYFCALWTILSFNSSISEKDDTKELSSSLIYLLGSDKWDFDPANLSDSEPMP